MAKQAFESVTDYIAQQPPAVQPILRRVRSILKKALPGAKEEISYNMPTFKLNGVAALYFAGWKSHYSIYPATDAMLTALKKELAPYKVHKGTLRFALDEPVPAKLLERIAKLRAKELSSSAKAKKR